MSVNTGHAFHFQEAYFLLNHQDVDLVHFTTTHSCNIMILICYFFLLLSVFTSGGRPFSFSYTALLYQDVDLVHCPTQLCYIRM